MPKRRTDADHRRFFDEFECVKIPRLRAIGVVQLGAAHAIIEVGDRQKLIGLTHVRFANGGSWSLFRCATYGHRANRLWLIEDRPLCRHCCEGIGIVHRSKWGFGRHERLRARPKARRADRQTRRDHAAALQSGTHTLARQSAARQQ
jgi:hypothetical protein